MAETVLSRSAIDAATSFTGDTDLINSFSHLDESTHQPHDKRTKSWTSNLSVACWVNDEAVVNAYSRKPKIICIQSNGAGSCDILHVQKSGANANVVKTDTVTLASGLNFFAIDSTGVTFSSKTWIGVKPATSSLVKYRDTTGFNTFTFSASGGAFTALTVYELGYWIGYHPREYLPRVVPGIPAAEFDLATALAEFDHVRLPPGDVTLSSTLTVPTKKKIEGVRGKSRILIPAGSIGLDISVAAVTLRDFSIVGTGAAINIATDTKLTTDTSVESLNGIGNEKGIYVHASATDILIDGLIVENVNGMGIDIVSTGGTYGALVSNVMLKNNYLGMRLGVGGEYNVVTNIIANSNLIGVAIYGGNNQLNGSNLARNKVALLLGPGSNNSHGTINCTSFNHSQLYGIYCHDIDYGFIISCCQCWYGNWKVDNSKGLQWSHGMISDSTLTFVDTPYAAIIDSVENVGPTVTITGTSRIEQRGRRNLALGTVKEPLIGLT